jgi:hypothetical protein
LINFKIKTDKNINRLHDFRVHTQIKVTVCTVIEKYPAPRVKK